MGFNKRYELNILGDSEIKKLKKEIKELQEKLILLENEKNDLEKLFSNFQHRHTTEVGKIILDIFKYKKLKLKIEDPDYTDVEKKEEKYKSLYENCRNIKLFELSDVDQRNLKKLFKKASKLCHPDKMNPQYKNIAQDIFNKLKKAYDNNDINTVLKIIEELENGNLIQEANDEYLEKNSLYYFIFELNNSISNIEIYISEIKQSESYQNIIKIDNLDNYFDKLKKELTEELSTLNSEIMTS
jgi:hypothetical protein